MKEKGYYSEKAVHVRVTDFSTKVEHEFTSRGLHYEAANGMEDPDAPVEYCLTAEAQPKLPLRVHVNLQNADELWLVFGGATFSRFPYGEVIDDYMADLKSVLDGTYRRIDKFVKSKGTLVSSKLQIEELNGWKTVASYYSPRSFWPFGLETRTGKSYEEQAVV